MYEDIKFKSPRSFAKWFIDYKCDGKIDLRRVLKIHEGYGTRSHQVQIGGHISVPVEGGDTRNPTYTLKKLEPEEIAVSRWNGEEVYIPFRIRDLAKEIELDRSQLKLF